MFPVRAFRPIPIIIQISALSLCVMAGPNLARADAPLATKVCSNALEFANAALERRAAHSADAF